MRPWDRAPATTIGRVGDHGWAEIHGTGLTFGIALPGKNADTTGLLPQVLPQGGSGGQ